MSPSALVPFCEFGDSMSEVAVQIDIFNVPVCNSFQAKILNDQLCYEVDLNKFSYNIEKELKVGFNFIMDYNEDRQIINDQSMVSEGDLNLGTSVAELDENKHAFIYLNTVGKTLMFIKFYSYS